MVVLRPQWWSGELPVVKKFRPLGRVMVVLEDPALYQQVASRVVTDSFDPSERGAVATHEDGTPKTVVILEKYDGADRMPAMRRAVVCAASPTVSGQSARKVRWQESYAFSITVPTPDGGRREVEQGASRKVVAEPLKVGDIVYYTNPNVGRQVYEENGLEYRLIGAHQVEWIEDPNGLVDASRFDLLRPPPQAELDAMR